MCAPEPALCSVHAVSRSQSSKIIKIYPTPKSKHTIASPKPFIIDAIVSPGELTMPPKITVGEAWGFGISKVKEGLMGLKGDHEVWKLWRDEFRANVL